MNKNLALLALTGILTLASCSQTPDVTCTTGQTLVNGQCVVSTGVVSISNPNNYTVVVKDASGNVVDPAKYGALTPGNYSVTFSKDGYVSQSTAFAVTAGNSTTVVAPTLSLVGSTGTPTTGAYYVDSKNAVHPITADMLKNAGSNFVFYAWLQNNNTASVSTTTTSSTIVTDGAAGNLVTRDVAPIKSQNLAAAYVGYKAADGNVYPVVGAGVRWDIVQDASQTNVRFAAADDGINAPGAVPLSLQPQYVRDQAMGADTFTNAANNTANAQFPSSTTYPLTNNAHLNAPGVDGATWTALWVPNQQQGEADISVIASIGNTEIDKIVLHKVFAPSAQLSIKKTVDNTAPVAPGQPRTFTITVTNTGDGPATGINLSDVYSGQAPVANYTLGTVTATNGATTTANTSGGFTSTFDLAPKASQTFTFTATGSASGQYCDTVTLGNYTNGAFGTVAFVNPTDGSNQACMTVVQPKLNILKQIANADGTVAANQTPTVAAGGQVYFKVTLTNSGTATATGVQVTDVLNTGNGATYDLGTVTTTGGTSATVANDGFTAPAQDIPVGGSISYLVPATATADGRYCDTASFTSTNAGTGSADACFTVATARLAITKTNNVTSVNPGGSYTSTITVTNTGTAPAVTTVQDIVGKNTAGAYLIPNAGGTYTLTGQPNGATTVSGNTFSAGTVTIPVGGTLTMNVTTTVPAATAPGQYCDVASYNSTNAQPATGSAEACINVVALLPTHIQSGDSVDPLKADGTTISTITFTSWIERTANENGINNVWNLNYGTTDPSNYNGAAGVFNYKNVHVYYDAAPTYDEKTGIITSDYNHGVEITSKVTLSATSGTGLLTITAPDSAFTSTTGTSGMAPGSVVYIRTDVSSTTVNPAGYQSVGRWTTTGSVDGVQKVNQAAENTVTN